MRKQYRRKEKKYLDEKDIKERKKNYFSPSFFDKAGFSINYVTKNLKFLY
jgi:hypothetical protein